MAVAFSFVGQNVVRVSGSAANSLPGSIIIKGIMATNIGTKGAAYRVKDLKTGNTIFYHRPGLSMTANPDWRLPSPQRCLDGILISTFTEGEMLIYKG